MKELALICLIVLSTWLAFAVLISFSITIGILLIRIGNKKIDTKSHRNSTKLKEK